MTCVNFTFHCASFFFFFCNFYVSAVPKKKRTYLTVYLFSLGSLERAAGIQDFKVEKIEFHSYFANVIVLLNALSLKWRLRWETGVEGVVFLRGEIWTNDTGVSVASNPAHGFHAAPETFTHSRFSAAVKDILEQFLRCRVSVFFCFVFFLKTLWRDTLFGLVSSPHRWSNPQLTARNRLCLASDCSRGAVPAERR